MSKFVAAITLTAVIAAPAFAQPVVRYYNTIPSSRSPAIVSNPSPRGFWAGDYVGGDPDPRIDSELLRDPPDDR